MKVSLIPASSKTAQGCLEGQDQTKGNFTPPPFFLRGDGTAKMWIRLKDWSKTSLGDYCFWPDALKNSLGIILNSQQPMLIWWGSELIQFFNDAFLLNFGQMQPFISMGQEAEGCWPGLWSTLKPQITRVLSRGESTWSEDQLVSCIQTGKFEDSYWTYGLSPIFLTNGSVGGVLGVYHETTEKVVSRKTLAIERDRFHDFFMQTPVPICVLEGSDYVFTWVNGACSKLFARDVAGRPLKECFTPSEVAHYLPYVDQVCLKNESVVLTEAPFHLFNKEGECKAQFVNALLYPYRDLSGSAIGAIAIFSDVTEQVLAREQIQSSLIRLAVSEKDLKEKTARFDSISNNIPQLAWMTDRDGFIFWYNQNWYDYTGTTLEQMRGWGWKTVHHPDFAKKVAEKWLKHLDEEKPWEDLFPLRSKHGEWRWFLSRANPAYDSHGRVTHWLGTNTDVTEQKKIREALEQANQAKEELLSVCSHELRTPVTSMKLSTQIFLRGFRNHGFKFISPQKVVQMVEQLDRQLDRLNRLIEEMLDFSRISGGRLKISCEKLDLTELVDDLVSRMSPQLSQEGIKIFLQKEGAISGEWDRFRLEQVLSNLLSNALKYGAGKPIRVRVWKKSLFAFLSVEDEGHGIDPGDHERIFLPYERGFSVRQISGLGLGLYISDQIIKAHGGSIQVESHINKGAKFIIKLPLLVSNVNDLTSSIV